MGKSKRFALEMNGNKINDIKELKEFFDPDKAVEYLKNGDLVTWLDDHYCEEADDVDDLDADDPQVKQKLCEIFGIEADPEKQEHIHKLKQYTDAPGIIKNIDSMAFEQNDVYDMLNDEKELTPFEEELEDFREERIEKLRKYTSAKKIIANVDMVAFDQEELGNFLEIGRKTIYLCQNRFIIPDNSNVKYIGIGKVEINLDGKSDADLNKKGIKLENIYIRISDEEIKEKQRLENIDRFVNEADTARREGNCTVAIEFYKKAAQEGDAYSMDILGDMYRAGKGVEKNPWTAVVWYEKAIKNGNASAMNTLGYMYDTSDGIIENKVKAIKLYRKAAEAGNTTASYNLGYAYYHGDGVDKNLNEAYKYFVQAANNNHSLAMRYLGDMYRYAQWVRKNISIAIKWYKKAARQENSYSMKSLGDIYRDGDGVEKNLSLAKKWYEKAIELGNANAMNDLGYMYDCGNGVTENRSKAIELYKKAVEGGNAMAMNNLGYIYYHGDGVARNILEGIRLYKKAAEAGNSIAMDNLGDAYRHGDGVSKDISEAIYWYEKAVGFGKTSAMISLGNIYRNGEGVPIDRKKSFDYFLLAAKAGDSSGMNNIACAYADGDGVEANTDKAIYWYKQSLEKDPDNVTVIKNFAGFYKDIKCIDKALELYKRAANKGDADAMNGVGLVYGKKNDYICAVQWYKKSAEAGYSWGKYNLAVMYKNGTGIGRDYVSAMYWFKEASDAGITDADYEIGNLYDKGKGVLINKSSAFKAYLKAANNGHSSAMNNVGYAYEHGEGVLTNIDKAINWYEKAIKANENNITAIKNLAHVYRNYKKNNDKALEFYKRAANKGDAGAMNGIGIIYAEKNDYICAAQWYKKSADNGYAWGKYNLAQCYQYGNGVGRNYPSAINWYKEAAKDGITDANYQMGIIYEDKEGADKKNSSEWFKNEALKNYKIAANAGNKDAAKAYESFKNSCFITTAVCDSFNKPDDCYELTSFRNFRDNWLLHQDGGKELVEKYYDIAPNIVKNINAKDDAKDIYLNIWNKYLKPCLYYIETNDNKKCKDTYITMVRELYKKYN